MRGHPEPLGVLGKAATAGSVCPATTEVRAAAVVAADTTEAAAVAVAASPEVSGLAAAAEAADRHTLSRAPKTCRCCKVGTPIPVTALSFLVGDDIDRRYNGAGVCRHGLITLATLPLSSERSRRVTRITFLPALEVWSPCRLRTSIVFWWPPLLQLC